MLVAVCHSSKTGWEKVEDLSTLSELREESGNLVWVETDSVHLTEKTSSLLAEEFGLHPLAVEDAIKPRQRPKIDDYDQHLFLVVHQLDIVDGQLEPAQLSIFVGQDERC